jgi:hypothetical protein
MFRQLTISTQRGIAPLNKNELLPVKRYLSFLFQPK